MSRARLWDEDDGLRGDAEELRGAAPRPNGHDAKARRRKIKLVPFDEMVPRLDETDLVARLLGSAGLSVVYGQPGCGKTFLGLDIALHVAADEEWLGRRVTAGSVVYLAVEAGEHIRNRVFAWRVAHRYAEKEAKRVPFFVAPTQIDLCTGDDDIEALIQAVREACGRAHPVLIVVDTLARAMGGGDENSGADMGALIQAADILRDEFGAHVMLIHHVGKDASRGARGHSSLLAAVDTAIEVTKADGAAVSVARVVKQRDGETGGQIAFVLDLVNLGANEVTGEPVTSCTVKQADAWQVADAAAAKKGDGKAAEIALAALQFALEEAGKRPPRDADCAADLWVRLEEWREHCYRNGVSHGKPRAQQAAFQRATDVLVRNHKVGTRGGYAWLIS